MKVRVVKASEIAKPKEVDRCLKEGGKEGYILSASANISVNTNAENFVHMVLCKTKGVYS